MIATCPHCQNGFYISPDMAGKVINCSKCKKQVRTPDRRSRGDDAQQVPSDGIPMALLAETKAETEERLKNETEARIEVEHKLKAEQEARAKAETTAKEQSEARARLEEQLREITQAKASLVERLNTAGQTQSDDQKAALVEKEIAAREKAEEAAREAASKISLLTEELKTERTARTKIEQQLHTASQERVIAEEKLQLETTAHADTQQRLKAESQVRSETETRLRTEIEARVKAEAEITTEAKLRAEIERRLEAELKSGKELDEKFRAEIQSCSRAETQLKAEAAARMRLQSQLEAESEKLARMHQELTKAQMQSTSRQVIKVSGEPWNLNKGLLRLAIILSIAGAAAGGLFAFHNGYIINSRFDRPMSLPFFDRPQLLPLNLIAISIAGAALVWAAYLLAWFIQKGFRFNNGATSVKKDPKTKKSKQSSEVFEEETGRPLEHSMWRGT